ncbi:MAG: M23 family metallopeptidase [Pseudomonadota bacterium]
MRRRVGAWFRTKLEHSFPEQRVYLRSELDTKFIRLTPGILATCWAVSALFVGWAVIATAILLMDSVGSGSLRDQAARERILYEERLAELSAERDLRAREALAAQDRFAAALAQISTMQSALLDSEENRRELEKGIEVIQATLRRTMGERDEARLAALPDGETGNTGIDAAPASGDAAHTLDFLTAALNEASEERDAMALLAAEAQTALTDLDLEMRLMAERNNLIFTQLEDAVSISLEPLDDIFSNAGLSAESILGAVRRGYSGQGGPLTPLNLSTKGEAPDPDQLRANTILGQLDKMNLYRIALQKTPFGMPIKSSFRFTSGFGMRWGRMHNGTDFAASHGTPIYTTADGVVTFAGWQGGYGRLVKIEHEFGIETRYAHLSKIRVKVGERVSRGERIGDMGNTGRSTGTHLHYEVRIGGKPINPMTYIKAARDVF